MSEKLDIILFGVTGLVGRYSLRHLLKSSKENNLTFGVAGRYEQKIKNVLVQLEEETEDKSIAEVPMILADMNNAESIRRMTSRCKVLIQTCGPLRKLGEVVVKACLESKTHYVDISAEENFINKLQVEYGEQAEEAGIYIVSACGVDCLIYDLGVLYVQEKFKGTVNSIETYLKTGTDDSTLTGPSYNVSTWKSTIDLMLRKKELKELQSKIFNKNLPKLKPTLDTKYVPSKPYIEEGWSLLLTGSDRSVMMRTQQHLYLTKKQRPIQIQTYFMLKELRYIIHLLIYGLMFSILLPFEFGRKILLKYPEFFSRDVFGKQEPSKAMCENSWFRITFLAKGWKNKIVGPDFNEKPDHGLVVKVKIQNAGYGGSALCLVTAGILLISQTDKLPSRRGVYTPGIAFGGTTLCEELRQYGISFDVSKEFDIST